MGTPTAVIMNTERTETVAMQQPQPRQHSWVARIEGAIETYCPEPLVFAAFLTLVVLVLALTLTDTGPLQAVSAWGNGLHSLLAFMTQMTLVIITAYVVAHTPAMNRLLEWLGRVPKQRWQAYTLVTLSSGVLSLLCWPLGLIAGGIIARQVALRCMERGINVHYPLLVAAAFGGFIVWHMGYSSSIGLALATEGNPLQDRIGGIIPVGETLLSWWNLLTICTTLTAVCCAILLMHPKDHCELPAAEPYASNEGETNSPGRPGIMGKLEESRTTSLFLALLLLIFLAHWFATRGFDLTLNIVNWGFLALGLLLANSIRHYGELFGDGAKTASAVLLQYPLYGGIIGLMLTTGLAEQFSNWVIASASPATLPVWGFLSAGLVNIFIPSGGAQWAVQGPIFVDAAQALNVDIRVIAMAIAWGDQWTNIIQPFCAIPLLAITGLKLRQFYGYCIVILLATTPTFILGLYLGNL